jgi:hypothetical protein
MTFDRDKAFDISDDGLGFDGAINITSGINAPVHSANEGDLYFRTDGSIWKMIETVWVETASDIFRDCSSKPTFHTSGANEGELDFIEFYKGLTQTTPNRRKRVDMTYDGNLNPTSEIWKFYSPSDGTTILKTFTITHVWSGVDLTRSEGVLS